MPDETENVQIVKMATRNWQEALIEMVMKQGLSAVLLLGAVYYLWAQLDRLNDRHENTITTVSKQHTQDLKNQAASYKIELDRTERLLSHKIAINQERAEAAAEKAEIVARKVDSVITPATP